MVWVNRYSSRITTLLVALVILFPILYLRVPQVTRVESPKTSTRSLATGTDSLLKQTALHLSKMQRGASVGGFPGFEPPDDDKKYRSKIKDGNYNAQDVNDWVKEINNFLRQIIDKNPGMTLEEILQKQGLTVGQVDDFLVSLRNVRSTVDSMSGFGVTEETVTTLTELMRILGVSTW